MKIQLLIICLLISITGMSKGKELVYPVFTIPDSLKEDANMVVRADETVLEILNEKEAVRHNKVAYTVLNKNGDEDAVLFQYYDTHMDVNITEASIYDALGRLIDKVKKSDIYDQCMFDGFSLFNDARFKRITPMCSQYPYTVVYEYDVKYDGYLSLADWYPLRGTKISVENSSLELRVPESLSIRFKECQLEGKHEVNDGMEIHSWSVKNMDAIESESYAPAFAEIIPHVELGVNRFEYEGHPGKLTSWEDLGRWCWELVKVRSDLSPERKAEIQNLVKDLTTDAEKVACLYKYMQDKTRYVSIQLGIGGFQPFPASKVDEVGYGDCKALSNYMRVLLDAVGIQSFYTLVHAGKSALDPDVDFCDQAFNHVILTVPLKNDTLFLECTSQTNPCGYLGTFTSDRNVLLVSEKECKIVRTPAYSIDDNLRESSSIIEISEKGDAIINETVAYQGTRYNNVRSELRKTNDKQLEQAYKNARLSGVEIESIAYKDEPDRLPKATRDMKFSSRRYASVMGKRMFLPINRLYRSTYVPRKYDEREYDVQIRYPYTDVDTVVYKIPEGFVPEAMPEPLKIDSKFGTYECSVVFKDNELVYTRKETLSKGRYAPETYDELVDFLKKIVTADKKKIVLVKG
ncbi:DUF3857 domain-containing protein [Puteibacter caeruleilacunae]|nr:DUF3857 domain-containing protein [Puteibacter caeruleilacunae]